MATLVVLKPFRICPRWPLKNPKVSLSTTTLYKFFKIKTIATNLPKISRKMYNRFIIMSNITNEPTPGMSPGSDPEKPLQIFRSTDPELSALATRSLQSVSIEKLDRLMKAHRKFNEPVYIIDEQGREERDNNFKLKRFLA